MFDGLSPKIGWVGSKNGIFAKISEHICYSMIYLHFAKMENESSKKIVIKEKHTSKGHFS